MQQVRQDLGEGLFEPGARWGGVVVGGCLERDGPQGGVVPFPAGGGRHGGEPLDVGRHHVVGQRLPQPAAQRAGVHRRGIAGQEGHQGRVRAGAAVGDDGGFRDAGMAGDEVADGQLHLGRLDPESADLDLGVGAAGAHDLAARQREAEVAGAVEAAGCAGQCDEAFLGQVVAAQIAARDRGAPEVQLARHTRRHGTQPRVHHDDLGAVDGGAHRGKVREVGRRPGQGVAGHHMGLGGAVLVLQHHSGQGRAQPPDLVGDPQLFGAGDDDAQRGRCDAQRLGGERQLRPSPSGGPPALPRRRAGRSPTGCR